jgi:hypothetical protein
MQFAKLAAICNLQHGTMAQVLRHTRVLGLIHDEQRAIVRGYDESLEKRHRTGCQRMLDVFSGERAAVGKRSALDYTFAVCE